MSQLTTVLWAIALAAVGGIVVSVIVIGALGAVARLGQSAGRSNPVDSGARRENDYEPNRGSRGDHSAR